MSGAYFAKAWDLRLITLIGEQVGTPSAPEYPPSTPGVPPESPWSTPGVPPEYPRSTASTPSSLPTYLCSYKGPCAPPHYPYNAWGCA
jgi:hypothetical protein